MHQMAMLSMRWWRNPFGPFVLAVAVSFTVTISIAFAEFKSFGPDYGESMQSNYYLGSTLIYGMASRTVTNGSPWEADVWARGFNDSGDWHMVHENRCAWPGNNECWVQVDLDQSPNNPPSSARYGTARHGRVYYYGTFFDYTSAHGQQSYASCFDRAGC